MELTKQVSNVRTLAEIFFDSNGEEVMGSKLIAELSRLETLVSLSGAVGMQAIGGDISGLAYAVGKEDGKRNLIQSNANAMLEILGETKRIN